MKGQMDDLYLFFIHRSHKKTVKDKYKDSLSEGLGLDKSSSSDEEE